MEKLGGPVCTEIRNENLLSLKIANTVGMREVGNDEAMTYWKLAGPPHEELQT